MMKRPMAVTVRVCVVGLVLGLGTVLGVVAVLNVSAGSNSWTPLDGPTITGGGVAALAVHPTVSGTLYAVVNSPGSESIYWGQVGKVFKTTDGAATWTAVYTPDVRLQSLALAGTSLYAGGWAFSGTSSIYRSDDSGASWSGIYTTTRAWKSVYALAINPAVTSTIYAAGMEGSVADPYVYEGVVHRSIDGGVNWTQTLTIPNYASFYALAVNPVTPTVVLASGGDLNGGFVYHSEDGGLNWTKVYTTPLPYYITSLAFHPHTPTLAYAASSWPGMPNTLYRSHDGGLTWSSALTNTAGPFALQPPDTIYVARAWGKVRKSTDGGDSWTEVGDTPGGAQSLAIDLAPTPHVLYAGMYERGVYTSTDGGANWTEANNRLELPPIPAVIAVDPQRPDYLYTAGGYPGGFRSTDAGAQWQQLRGVPNLYTFAINPLTTSIVYAGGDSSSGATILRSMDSGVNWTGVHTSPVVTQGGYQAIRALAIDPLTPTTIYAGGVDMAPAVVPKAVILRSAAGGHVGTWTQVYTATTSRQSLYVVMAINPVTTSIVYAGVLDCGGGQGCLGTVYRSIDDGQNWTAVLTSIRVFRSLVIDHWHPNVVYAADENYVVYKSTDGGDNWAVIRQTQQQPGDPPSGCLLAIDPRVPSNLYLAGMGWVGRSRDSGSTWEDLNAGLPWSLNPTALALDSSTVTQTLYLGANGVWVYSQAWPGSIIYLPLVMKNYNP